MFNSLTTFNLSDEFNSSKSSSSTFYSEQFASQVQWFNILNYFEQKRTRQEAIDKVQWNFSLLKLTKNNMYVQWTWDTDDSFLQWWFQTSVVENIQSKTQKR